MLLLVLWAARRWERNLPPLERLSVPPRNYPLGCVRWPCFGVLSVAIGTFIMVPVAGFVWNAGLAGRPRTWSAGTLWGSLEKGCRTDASLVSNSLLVALVAGLLAAGLGLVVCWLCLKSRWFRLLVFVLLAAVLAVPGPVIGQGLKVVMGMILDVLPFRVVEDALWNGPSPLPVIWADLIRFLPCGVALLWPAVRLMPDELLDAARVDGAGPTQILRHLIVPLFALAGLWAMLAVAVLSFEELGTSKLVCTPGWPTFTPEVISRMHEPNTHLYALCLIMLGVVAVAGTLVGVAGWLMRKASHPSRMKDEG